MTEYPLQVAIIHQDPKTRDTLHRAVSQLGHFICIQTGSRREFAKQAHDRKPDLIIIQESQSDGKGMQALQIVGDHESIPTILILSKNESQSLEESAPSNVFALLQEPVRSSSLKPLISLVMQQFAQIKAQQEIINQLQKELDSNP